jgi:flagellin
VNAGGVGQLGIDTFSIAYSDLLAPLTNSTDAELRFTDSNDNVLIIGAGDVTGANVGQGSSLTEIAAGINAKLDTDTVFAPMSVAVNGDSTALVFTQDTSGTGQIKSVAGYNGTTSVAVGTGIIRTQNSGSDTVSFQIGTNAAQMLNVEFGTLKMTGATGNDFGGTFTTALAITSNANANTAMTTLDAAIDAVSARRATLGAAISRLEHTVDNLENNAVNSSASRSRILDADYAAETTELARTQIIQQAGTAMLSQANEKAQAVLKLLQ